MAIASHGEGRNLPRLVEELLSLSPPPSQVIVVVDAPAPGLLERIPRAPAVKVVARPERLGKVSALNTALSLADGDIVLFLDDDVSVPDSRFIASLTEEMRGSDIAEIKKVVTGKGLLASLVYLEYLGLNMAALILSRLAGRSPMVNGAAFAATRSLLEELGGFRPVLYEDLDLATRAFLAGARYRYVGSTYVLNDPPRSWGEWLKQRKRWSVGAALWLREYMRPLLRGLARMKLTAAAALLVALPSIVSTAVVFVSSRAYAVKLAYLALLLASTMAAQLLPVASLFSVNLHLVLLARLVTLGIMLAVLSVPYLVAARMLRVESKLPLYPIYFLVYQPLWFTVLIAGMARVYLLGRDEVEDWVVSAE